MEITIDSKHNTLIVEFLNTFFIKFWGTTPLIALTLFGNKLLLFLAPGDVDGWVKLAVTSGAGLLTLIYMRSSSRRKARHEEEKHRQDLAQDKMDGWLAQYRKALDAGIIKPETTLADFIKQLETIEAASLINHKNTLT